jgi:hypothetical protein
MVKRPRLCAQGEIGRLQVVKGGTRRLCLQQAGKVFMVVAD